MENMGDLLSGCVCGGLSERRRLRNWVRECHGDRESPWLTVKTLSREYCLPLPCLLSMVKSGCSYIPVPTEVPVWILETR